MRDPEAQILVDAPYMSNRKQLPVKWGFIEGFFEIQIFPSQGKYVCGLFGEQSERILGGQK